MKNLSVERKWKILAFICTPEHLKVDYHLCVKTFQLLDVQMLYS